MKNRITVFFAFVFISLASTVNAQLPEPGAARKVSIPAVKEIKLKNGLTVAVIEKRNTPLVSVALLVRGGASSEGMKKAGLANLTASLLTKGTKTRSANQISEEMEFLGSGLNTSGGWLGSNVSMNVTSDKLDAAMPIFADVVLNPTFPQEEIDLERSQALDGLKYNLTQPGFLASYVASVYSFGEHPVGGTPASLEALTRADLEVFYKQAFRPESAVLIFVGDITAAKAAADAEKYLGSWRGIEGIKNPPRDSNKFSFTTDQKVFRRFLVVDLPESGQASVNYIKRVNTLGRNSKEYYAASVLNSLLGGGYSSRLNQEIRIKRGLSYGAGSSFGWRPGYSNFRASTQTKEVSAAEVAELIVAEITRLRNTEPTAAETDPRKAVLTGGFGQNLETGRGLAGAVADLYSFGIPTSELNAYMSNVNSVKNADLTKLASQNFVNGDILIVGDYSKFKDDLAKRFPNTKIDVIKVDDLNIESPTLRKGDLK